MIEEEAAQEEFLVYAEGTVSCAKPAQAMCNADQAADVILSYETYAENGIGDELPKIREWRVRRNLYLCNQLPMFSLNRRRQSSAQSIFDQFSTFEVSETAVESADFFGALRVDARTLFGNTDPLYDNCDTGSNPFKTVRGLRKADFPKLKKFSVLDCSTFDIEQLAEMNTLEFEVIEVSESSLLNALWAAKLRLSAKMFRKESQKLRKREKLLKTSQ